MLILADGPAAGLLRLPPLPFDPGSVPVAVPVAAAAPPASTDDAAAAAACDKL